MENFDTIKETHIKFAHQRGEHKSYCPSEVAKEVFDSNWRNYMAEVRKVADELVIDKKLIVLQQGSILKCLPTEAKGPIRLRKPVTDIIYNN